MVLQKCGRSEDDDEEEEEKEEDQYWTYSIAVVPKGLQLYHYH